MATTSHKPLLLFFFLLLLSLPSLLLAAGGSIHSLLLSHGLPAGLLPRSVRDFSLEPSTGLLSVRLDRACRADYDRSPVHFDRVVEANLTYGSLSAVTGLSQEELFLWLPVKEISVAGQKSGVIFFDMGVAHKQLSASVFENPPECQPEDSGIGYNDILEGGFQKRDQ